MKRDRRFRVVIGGSGPAAIEAALVLRGLADRLVETTLVTPDEECVHLPMTVLTPFARSGSTRYPLADLVSDAGAILHRGTIASVDARSRVVRTAGGETLAYDALLVAVGGVQQLPYPRALTYGAPGSEERMHRGYANLQEALFDAHAAAAAARSLTSRALGRPSRSS